VIPGSTIVVIRGHKKAPHREASMQLFKEIMVGRTGLMIKAQGL
jgi:hypothetical protein